MKSFQLVGLAQASFKPLFDLSDLILSRLNIQRVTASTNPGYPCRVSLTDAQIGEELLLLPFEHQPADSPYKASGPIFVRRKATDAQIPIGVVPDYVTTRLISARAYDDAHLMVDARVCAGVDVAHHVSQLFDAGDVAYIHLHNAARGCFSCRVNRA